MDDPFASGASAVFPHGINAHYVLEFFKSSINEEKTEKIRWSLVKHCIALARSNLASAFQGLLPVIPFLSLYEIKKFLRVCASRQIKNKEIEYSALLFAFLKHIPSSSLYSLVTAHDVDSDHRMFVLKFLSYQPYLAEMIRFVPCSDLPRYFSILKSQISPGDFVSGLAADQISQIVWHMHPESQRDDLDTEEWQPLETALSKNITKNSWWADVTPRQLQNPRFPRTEKSEKGKNRESEEFETENFWFAKKLLVQGDQAAVMVRLWEDKVCFDDFLQIVLESGEVDLADLLLQLESQIQDTQCAIRHVLDWANRITASCSHAQAMRTTQFAATLQARVANLRVTNTDLHIHVSNAREGAAKSVLGKRANEIANLGNDDGLSLLYKAARDKLSGTDLENLLTSLDNMTSNNTSASESDVVRVILFFISLLDDISANLLIHTVSPQTHQIVQVIFPLLTRTLPAAAHNAALRDYYHIRHRDTARSYSAIPVVLITSVELLSFLIGSEPQTYDVITQFVHRFLEVSAQDPERTGDAARFEQFSQLLLWVWERYHDLLVKYLALLRTARASGATHKPAFSDAVVNFVLQMISKPHATQDYVPGITVLHAPAASPLRTSAQASPTQPEPVYAAHHAPYVFRALLARSASTRDGSPPLDARLLTSLVTASRLDLTKWKCFKVINFLLEEVQEVANGILLGKGEAEDIKGSEKREQMKGLIGCVVAHLKPDSTYRALSGVAFATLGTLMCDPPTLYLLLALQSLPTNLLSILPNSPANHINARLNASTALQLLISEGAENSTVSQRLAAFCDRHNLALTLVDHIIANREGETKEKEAQVCSNLLDSLSVMVSKIPGQSNKIIGRANDLLNFCGNKNILYSLQNEVHDCLRFVCAIFVSLVRVGWKELSGIATLASLELDFLVSNCPGSHFIESVLELVEEIVNSGGKDALAMLSNMQIHMKIKSLLAAQHKNITKAVGTRLVAMGRQITTKGLT